MKKGSLVVFVFLDHLHVEHGGFVLHGVVDVLPRGEPVAEGSDHDLDHPRYRALGGARVLVTAHSQHEYDDRKKHRRSWDREPDGPGNLLLNVNDEDRSDERPDVDRKVKPVEERLLVAHVSGVPGVKLVRSESAHVWLDATGPHRDDVKGAVQDAELERRGQLTRWRREGRLEGAAVRNATQVSPGLPCGVPIRVLACKLT